eukprot:TRINITY_DN167_c0_g1_i1.p1 TRINITY_DN167_c0_g1~~TRINITY_DN167_c0_g1_i1.p1  ORF type:complete len:776 (-),score=290.23 TRINITY_DN167_c0_g1_i1:117-2444(-)
MLQALTNQSRTSLGSSFSHRQSLSNRLGRPQHRQFAETTTSSSDKKNATLTVRDDGVALVRFDQPDSKVNTLNESLTKEFGAIMDQIERDDKIKSVVLLSDKKDCFIAGADIDMLARCQTKEEVTKLSSEGQKMMDRVANSKKPFIAAISGSCLGGGLELALACHYRIATKSPKTSLGLPEVQLGILPGAGGTQRLPKLVGLPDSLDMMLTGKNIRADKAKKMGLVDLLVDPIGPGVRSPEENSRKYLEDIAVRVAGDIATGKTKLPVREKPLTSMAGLTSWALSTSFGRNFVFNKAKKGVEEKTAGNYPAPFAILDVVKNGLENGVEKGLQLEADKFGELARSSESSALMNIFFGQNQLKKNRFGNPEKPTKTVAVLGAGLMGAGIAQVSIQKGLNAKLKDMSREGLARGEQYIDKNLSTSVKKRQMTAWEKEGVLTRLTPVLDYNNFKDVDMVIEAVFEDINLKRKVLAEVENNTGPDTIFASNTSALPIADIAKGCKRPDKVIGMHYFSPVEKMPLLEIITTPQTSKETAAAAVQVGLQQGKTVIVVKDGVGFYTTRILAPMLNEAFELLTHGVSPDRLDKVMKKFGFPVGPITLADEVGIDVGKHVATNLAAAFPSRMGSVNLSPINDMVEAKFLGKKSGKGFYLYDGKKKSPNPEAAAIIKKYTVGENDSKISDEDIQLRMVGVFTNEAIHCLQDGILDNPVDGDMGAVFGLGFPPFLGGPFRWVDTYGAQRFVDKMNHYAQTVSSGERFKPAQLVVDNAKAGKTFHSKK